MPSFITIGSTQSWFSRDAYSTEATDLVDGAAPAPSVTMTWTDSGDVSHTSTYSIVEDRLVRDYDGNQQIVARDVVSTGFFISGRMLTLDLEVKAAQGDTDSATFKTYLRGK